MINVVAYFSSEDRSGALTNLAGVPDSTIQVSGDNIRLSNGISNIAYAFTKSMAASYEPQRTVITSANISQNAIKYNSGGVTMTYNGGIHNIPIGADFTNDTFNFINPLDNLSCQAQERDQAGTAHALSTVLVTTDQATFAQEPRPKISYEVQFSGFSGNTTVGEWSEYDLNNVTFDTLPAGVYQISGGRAQSATAIAWRLVYNVGPAGARPGGACVNNALDINPSPSEYFGVGRNFVSPEGLPKIEFLTGTAEVPDSVVLYMTRVS